MNKSTKAHSVLFSCIAIILLVPAIGAWDSQRVLPKHVDIVENQEVVIPAVESPHTVTVPTYMLLDTVMVVGDKQVSQRVTKGSTTGNLEWSCTQRAEGIQRIDDKGNVVRIDPIKVCEWK